MDNKKGVIVMGDSNFNWLKNIWKGVLPLIITSAAMIGVQALDLFKAEVDAGGLQLGFLTGVIIGLVNMAINFLKHYGK